jgi:hypothetical protein
MSDVTTINPAGNRIAAIEVGRRIWERAEKLGEEAWDGAKWIGGALAGDFNKQQTIGQILTDAIVSMFPVLGEITAARDAISHILNMCEDPEKCEDRWEWIGLVLCLIAVVPVLGGVIKGVGKLALRAVEKGEDLGKLAAEIIRFLNRMGVGNAYEWLRKLDFTTYTAAVMGALTEALSRIRRVCEYALRTMSGVLPDRVVRYLSAVPRGLDWISIKANNMVPQALKELNTRLAYLRTHLVEGTWAEVSVSSGKIPTRVMEGRMANAASDVGKIPHPKAAVDQFKPKKNWPDLREDRYTDIDKVTQETVYTKIESFSRNARIVATTLEPGEIHIFRIIDPTKPGWTKSGKYWLERLPRKGMEWRELWAVLFSWNRNGGYVELTKIPTIQELRLAGVANIPKDWDGLHAWRGLVASQFDEKLGRYLSGGETQLFIDFKNPYNAVLLDYVRALITKRTAWDDVNVAAMLNAVVVPMEKNETAPKTTPQGYTTHIPAATDDSLLGTATSQH